MLLSLTAALSWPPPNLENPETLAPANTVIISTLHVIVTILLVIRLYSRRQLSGGLRLDDLLIVLAYVPTTLYAAGGIHQELALKIDRHIWDFPKENTVASFKSALAIGILFASATTLTKLSMLALIYRITSAAGQHVTRCLVLLVITIVAVDGVIFILVELTQCMPLSLFWTPSFTPQNCINQADHLLAAGIINTVTDFIIVLLPIKTILGLNLPRRQLVGIQVLLGGGVLATIVGAVRVYFTWESHEAADGDITWRSHLVIALSALELYIGIFCASLPATKPFFERLGPRLFGSFRSMSVIEPLSIKRSNPKPEDEESAIGSANLTVRQSSWGSAPMASLKSPPPAYTQVPKRFTKPSTRSFLPYIGTQQQRFAWKPLISPPVITSPITPTFRVRNNNMQSLQSAMGMPPPSIVSTNPLPLTHQTSTTGPYSAKAAAVPGSTHSSTSSLNLNKPLPKVKIAPEPEWRNSRASKTQSYPIRQSNLSKERVTSLRPPPPPPATSRRGPNLSVPSYATLSRPVFSAHSSSVFDFVAHDDGHISVHKTPRIPEER
ncbi:hypothetical protein MCOR27_010061 [Pyricularia oryzae]|uniref:Rhodopsin domain-containing protein n=5 Tax=Pyricularia TaxID=48558 RepID=A0ABQ8NED1_PYRGI|nr:uncharacterized protein MGG_11370 [Pyricularia oryzae 70-15]ELQ42787.1 hypothetical protein OOU_Y34scaffold00194g100 [Pyricularia oryzae Y34]KAH8837399.1 hypothetical protein MCOR01_011023 [Pyricularia oryzae]KAI6294459.1 hypothetical protein MCOR33_008432 [Pyricularia grisea]EHA53866.1 hypothetical protein MGG_11370 [Pyricularia oryzae 70-15]KAH9437923.1 hypothetical protein MCOR02_001566 [Pyricularia oryzae]